VAIYGAGAREPKPVGHAVGVLFDRFELAPEGIAAGSLHALTFLAVFSS
jgi:hypothetical protein